VTAPAIRCSEQQAERGPTVEFRPRQGEFAVVYRGHVLCRVPDRSDRSEQVAKRIAAMLDEERLIDV